jgi:S-adenosylhomocysteine hydrolase
MNYDFLLLQRVKEIFSGVRLERVLLFACQHLLEPQQRMFEALLALGLPAQNCVIFGKNYSTSEAVLQRLVGLGCVVAPFSTEFDPRARFDSWFEDHLRAFVTRELARRDLSRYSKIIVLDDGGHMHLIVNEQKLDPSKVFGIEQTSSGHFRIVKAGVSFEWVSVARSYHKLMLESPYIGRIGACRIHRALKKHRRTSPNVLVYGLGHIGRQIAGQLFGLSRLTGSVFDAHPEKIHGEPFGCKGVFDMIPPGAYIDVDTAKRNLSRYDVIVGTTGSSVLSEGDVDTLHPEVMLISMSSSDREFPSALFRVVDSGVHHDYTRGSRVLVNGGFPITFDGTSNPIPPRQIEFTIALLMIHLLAGVNVEKSVDLGLIIEQIRGMWDPEMGSEEWYTNFNAQAVP